MPMFLRTPDAAEYLSVSKSFLEKCRVYGGGPRFVKLGSAVVYRKSDLDAWADERTRTSTSQHEAA
jgi:excisionase family DNA binding protein